MHKNALIFIWKQLIFFNMVGVNILHQLTQVYLNHHTTQPILLAMTKCVGHTTHNFGHILHHDDTIDE